MGAGHSVTAIYEITPARSKGKLVDPLRYKASRAELAGQPGQGAKDELCFIKLRYKLPGESTSRQTEHVVHAAASRPSMAAVPDEQRFAVAVAAFAQRLRDEKDIGDFSYAEIAKLAESGRGADPQGYRAEFVKLVHAADTLGSVGPIGQR
jgi:Ca-activated chloride channel family protein